MEDSDVVDDDDEDVDCPVLLKIPNYMHRFRQD